MIFSTLAKTLATSGILLTTPIALPMECTVTKAPTINVNPQTKQIEYDRSKSASELNQFQVGTISPYGMNVDQTTGGLRRDEPSVTMEMTFSILQDPLSQSICLTYNQIDVDILLSPQIYLAKEFDYGQCAEEVLKHEKKHVTVDREIINKYTKILGANLVNAVNEIGALGPYPVSRLPELQTMMSQHLESVMNSTQLALNNEMNKRQQEVDSLEEYERVNSYCKEAGEKLRGSR